MHDFLFDNPAPERRGGKEPVEVSLFVHKVLAKSLLCSEHGENRYIGRNLAGGKIIAWKTITWPDEEQRKQKQAFRSWEMRDAAKRQPICLTFAIPEWLAMQEGLI